MQVTSIRIISTFTSEPVLPYVKWWLEKQKKEAVITFAPYNQVFQEVLNQPESSETIHFYLIRWEDYIRESKRSSEEKKKILALALENFCTLLGEKRFSSPCFIGVLPMDETSLESPVRNYLKTVYETWSQFLSSHKVQNLRVIDLRELPDQYETGPVFDRKRDQLAHIPYTEKFYCALGTVVVNKIFARTQKPFKVIVVDADNTLWDGICGEVGPTRVKVTDGFRAFHQYLISKVAQGFLLTMVSKNNEGDVMNVFSQNTSLALGEEHFVLLKINWDRKSENINALAAELNLGLDSFVFFDDNPSECMEVNIACPEVLTIQMPCEDEIADFVNHLWFLDKFLVTGEDAQRTFFYQAEAKRVNLKRESNFIDFLRKLDIKINFTELLATDVERASQLTLRTNQFNSGGPRRTSVELTKLLNEGHHAWAVHVRDQFGEYGFTGLVIGKQNADLLEIETFLLSCRVLGKDIEYAVLAALKLICLRSDFSGICIDYYRTERNHLFGDFLAAAGGQKTKEWGLSTRYYFRLDALPATSEHIDLSFVPAPAFETHEVSPLFVFHHVGVAVNDISTSKRFYEAMGFEVSEPLFDPQQQVSLAMCTRRGDIRVELVAPINDDSPVKSVLSKNGEIPYHLCYKVENLSISLNYLKEKDIDFTIIKPASFAILFKAPVMFIHVKGVGTIELVETKTESPEASLSNYSCIQLLTADAKGCDAFFKAIGSEMQRQQGTIRRLANHANALIEILVTDKTQNAAESLFYQKNGPHPYAIRFSKNFSGERLADTPRYLEVVESNSWVQGEQKSFVKWNWKQLIPNLPYQTHQDIYSTLRYRTVEAILSEMNYGAPQTLPTGITATERKLWAIWRDVLKRNDAQVDKSFFDLGGHSLLATQIISRISNDFEVDLSMNDFFENSTIREMASLLCEESMHYRKVTRSKPIPLLPHQSLYDLSSAQKRTWVLEQGEADNSFNNMIRAYRLDGHLDYKQLDQAYLEIIKRHESLRTVFLNENDEPSQQILPPASKGFEIQYFDLSNDCDKQAKANRIQIETALHNFNLERGPLLLVRVIKLEARVHIFLLTIHHIITDGWSMGVLFHELTKCYNHTLLGEQWAPEKLNLQYKDYAHWSNQQAEKFKAYWLGVFSDAKSLPYVLVPADYLRPAQKTFDGNTVGFQLDCNMVTAIRQFGRQHDASDFMVLTALYTILLCARTELTDIIIGTPTAGRVRSELENQIGLYINTLALRTSFQKTNTFAELVRVVKKVILDANDYQLFPFERLINELGIERFADRSPLFETGITWQSHNELEGEMNGIAMKQLESEKVMSQHDLWLLGSPNPDGVTFDFNLVYNTNLFRYQTVERLKNDFLSLAVNALRAPSLSVEALIRLLANEESTQHAQNKNMVSVILDDNF